MCFHLVIIKFKKEKKIKTVIRSDTVKHTLFPQLIPQIKLSVGIEKNKNDLK